jgi:diacylglycerol kinase (ATP)
MRVLFIVNQNAGGSGSAKIIETALARFNEADWHVITTRTKSKHDADELITTAGEQGYDLLVIGGGDGSIHHLIGHLPLGTPDKPAGIPFGIIPIGSGNDFYRGTGAPMDPWGAADNIVNGTAVPIDVGLVEPLYDDGSPRSEKPIRFTNTAGMGLDSQTLELREKSPSWLSARYDLLFLMTLARLKPIKVVMESDEWRRELEAYWILCCNNGFIGTGMHVAPNAEIDDGLLDILVVGKLSKIRFVVNLPGVFKGKHIHQPGIEIIRTRSVILKSDPDFRLAIDGDREFKPPARISIIKGAVRLRTRPFGKQLQGAGQQ